MANIDGYLREVADASYPDRLTAFLHLIGIEPYVAGMPVAFRDGYSKVGVGEEDVLRPHVIGTGAIVCDLDDGWRRSSCAAWVADGAEWMKLDGVRRFLEGSADELAISALDVGDERGGIILLAYCR